jgi:multidrug efflux pump subunit AcrB
MFKSMLRLFFSNPVLANILMLLIFGCGIAGYMTMTREIFPRFTLDKISVTVLYPGADPDEVEEGIAIKLEEALDGIEGIKDITTTSKEGVCSVLVECNENADVTRVKDKVKNAVDSITTFPLDAENPIVAEVEFRDAVCSLVVWGDRPEHQLKEIARSLEREILQIDGISQSGVSGIRNYEISIEVNEDKLRKFNIDFNKISRAVRDYGINLSAGTLRTPFEEIRLKAIGRRHSAKEYRNIPIITKKDGTLITLGQIASIKDSFDEDAQIFSLFNGKPAVAVNIFKTDDEDSIDIVALVDKFIAEKNKELPAGIHLSKFMDRSRVVADRLNMLISNGILGLCLVFVSLWMFLDLRLSFWVAMGIPISLSGALAIMALSGASINMISMFGMIMVLGLIVDDAIVVGEAIYHRRQTGDGMINAAVNGTAEVAFPVIAAVLTTIIAFLPLFFIPGIMGKFIGVMPVPVVAALGISLVEGLFILPIHLRHLPAADTPPVFALSKHIERIRGKINRVLTYFIENIYGKAMEKILPNRYIALAVALVVIIILAGVFKSGMVKFSLLPDSDDDFLQARIELPAGTPASKTVEVAKQISAAWEKVEANQEFKKRTGGRPISVAIYALVGSSIDWRKGVVDGNSIEISIELLPSEERNIFYKELVTAWKNAAGDIPGAVSTSFSSIQKGPGGMPIAFNLMGENKRTLKLAADKLAAEINKKKGTYDVSTDFRQGKREFSIRMKPDAAKYGITLRDVAEHIQSGFFGKEALRIQNGRDDVKVKIKYPKSEGRNSISFFKKLRIKNRNGDMVPLRSVAELKLSPGQSIIRRKYRMRKIRVSADVDKKKGNANDIIKDLEKSFIPTLTKEYGITCEVSGQQSESRDSLGALWFLFPIAMFGIYFIIASIFRSYIQPMVIMTTIPFGMIGAIIGHFVFGANLCIFSMFGMVALAGIVVNDAIVFIECVNNNLELGEPLFLALRNAGKRRFRAIMLTTLTTFSGLMPLILERSAQAAFLKPMAISIAFGVLFATIITLVLIPCFIGILNDIRRYFHYIFTGRMPTREEVEARAKVNLDKAEL